MGVAKYGLIACAAIIIGLIIGLIVLSSANDTLKEQNDILTRSLSNCNAALELQNAKVAEANAKLESFQNDIDKINKQYKAKSKELDKSIAQINTCESAMEYLKSSLIELKGL
jgi:peptidoglycan hydrolase CwlO-like protein